MKLEEEENGNGRDGFGADRRKGTGTGILRICHAAVECRLYI